MAKVITFPDSPQPWPEFDRRCLAFPALVDGQPVVCVVTEELLFFRFGAGDWTEEAMLSAYRDHLAEIHAIARTHIENGWIDEDNRVSLTTRFTRLNVTFDDDMGEFPGGRAAADSAHRILSEIIGPNAEAVNVEWTANVDPGSAPAIDVRITDPTLKYSLGGSFGPKEASDPTTLSVYLARLWSSILRERSRRLGILAG